MAVVTAPNVHNDTAVPPRPIPVRRVDFGFPASDLPRHFMGGDLIASHVVVGLSCMFPDGEDFFVDSVRHYRDRIGDPELRRQVAGFIGQEAIHGREHRAFNARLRELGYPTRYLEGRVRLGLAVLRRFTPPEFQLAVTAALEHWTATLAEYLLATPDNPMVDAPDEIRDLFLWHAIEESEHKSVAFDVFEQVCGEHRTRAFAMRFISFFFQAALLSGLVVTLATDPATRQRGRLRSSLGRAGDLPFADPAVRRSLRAYLRPGFHPDQVDATALLERWRDELFGDTGRLSSLVRGRTGAG